MESEHFLFRAFVGEIGVYRVEAHHLTVDDPQSEVVDAVEHLCCQVNEREIER